MKIGYARVSTKDQSLALQLDALRKSGCDEVYTEVASGARAERPVLDVRQPNEWTQGHIPRALFITGAELPARSKELPRDRPVAVICGSGYRSSVLASLLKRRGLRHVFNVLGGMEAWGTAGMPTTREGT